MSDISDKT